MYFPNCFYFSLQFNNIRILGLEASLSTSIWMTDRWVRLVHASQMYCFYRFCAFYYCLRSRISGGYSMRLGWVFSRFSIHEQGCCCSAAKG